MLSEDIRRKLTEAVIKESAQLDGVRPEEMVRDVVDYLDKNGTGNKKCSTAQMLEHKGMRVNEDVVRRIATAVVKEAAQLDGVNPEEVLQKVVGALQGDEVESTSASLHDDLIFKNRGVEIDEAICRKVSDAVIREASQLEGVVPEEAIEKVLSALRAQPAREMEAVAKAREMAASARLAQNDAKGGMGAKDGKSAAQTAAGGASYKGVPRAAVGTDAREVVIGVGPGFQKEIHATVGGVAHDDVVAAVAAGVRAEGLTPRIVRVLKTSDVGFMSLEAAKISGSGIGVSLSAKGASAIHRKDAAPSANLEMYSRAACMTAETYRAIGVNAAKYAKGETAAPISVRCENAGKVRKSSAQPTDVKDAPVYPVIAWDLK